MYACILYESALDVDHFGDEPIATLTAECNINYVFVGDSMDEVRNKAREFMKEHPNARRSNHHICRVDG
ncbi:MAG: hypothetical protein IJ092_00565 [Atopobiaceae bacterium]|nr:hypothetical protein [Atopobiaceae bacterium]